MNSLEENEAEGLGCRSRVLILITILPRAFSMF
jgi:hypothetical protein